MYALPTKEQLLKKLNEGGNSLFSPNLSFQHFGFVALSHFRQQTWCVGYMILVMQSLWLCQFCWSLSENSAKVHMQSYVSAATPVILYINGLFITRELGVDWWNLPFPSLPTYLKDIPIYYQCICLLQKEILQFESLCDTREFVTFVLITDTNEWMVKGSFSFMYIKWSAPFIVK